MQTITKFTEAHISMARFAGAMAHPARISIVGLLRDCEEATCGELVEALPLAQATVSQHLKVLVESGILSIRKDGPKMFYRLECEQIRSFCHSFQCTLGTEPQEESS